MTEFLQKLREALAEGRADAIAGHRAGRSGLETSAALTAQVDAAVRSAFGEIARRVNGGLTEGMAVLALGGYGRVELCPASDVDIMILYGDDIDAAQAGEAATALLHLLWDAGLDLGHSVRSAGEAAALHGTSLDAWATLLESRFVCGNRSLAGTFYRTVTEAAGGGPDRWFLSGVLEEIARRHERHGNSVKLLEPNIKKSAGGLRDLQSLFWLRRSLHGHPGTTVASEPACLHLLRELATEGEITAEEHASAEAALAFLLRTRHEMHRLRASLHDTLEHALQRDVADGLGFGPVSDVHAVEAFMREYYRHARTIRRLHVRLVGRVKERLGGPPALHHEGERVGEHFFLRGDRLALDPAAGSVRSPAALLAAFAHAAEEGVDLDAQLAAGIEQSADVIDGDAGASPELAGSFRRILASRRVAPTLRVMNDLGILGRYIPEFGELVAFVQHSMYHYYTADEHTLIAVAKAEQLREEEGVLHEVFRNFRPKEMLYLAILLHDIAKPRGLADHERVGEEMSEVILHRLGLDAWVPEVRFLVRNHLLMEQVAFRRNIHDPATIREFSSRFASSARLDALYLLTFADLSAVNPGVWTEWKGSLLQELYLRTAEVLNRELRGDQVTEYHRAQQETTVRGLIDRLKEVVPEGEIERHIATIPNRAYLALFTEEEIARHIGLAASPAGTKTLFAHQEGFTEVTVVGTDAPFVLSRCCAVLSANDANIFDASVFTRDDGVIIDRFRVVDGATGTALEPRVCAKIEADMSEVLAGSLDVEHLFEAHRRRWRRRAKPVPSGRIRQDVEFEDADGYTIIDVYAADALGLLYRLTETMSRLGLSIHFARIATRGDGVVDAFYTLDGGGVPLTGDAKRNHVRGELLATIRDMTERELA